MCNLFAYVLNVILTQVLIITSFHRFLVLRLGDLSDLPDVDGGVDDVVDKELDGRRRQTSVMTDE